MLIYEYKNIFKPFENQSLSIYNYLFRVASCLDIVMMTLQDSILRRVALNFI